MERKHVIAVFGAIAIAAFLMCLFLQQVQIQDKYHLKLYNQFSQFKKSSL